MMSQFHYQVLPSATPNMPYRAFLMEYVLLKEGTQGYPGYVVQKTIWMKYLYP